MLNEHLEHRYLEAYKRAERNRDARKSSIQKTLTEDTDLTIGEIDKRVGEISEGIISKATTGAEDVRTAISSLLLSVDSIQCVEMDLQISDWIVSKKIADENMIRDIASYARSSLMVRIYNARYAMLSTLAQRDVANYTGSTGEIETYLN